MSDPVTSFELISDDAPLKLTADPADNVFRRLAPSEIPPTVNALKSSPSVITVLAAQLDPVLEKAAKTLALSLGLQHNQFIAEDQLDRQLMVDSDILMIGRPRHAEILKNIPTAVDIRSKSFSLNQATYHKASDAFFGVFTHPYAQNRIMALFMPLSPEYAEVVAAKITHYGKYSYLAFQNGKNKAKGFWPVETSPLIYEWKQLTDDG